MAAVEAARIRRESPRIPNHRCRVRSSCRRRCAPASPSARCSTRLPSGHPRLVARSGPGGPSSSQSARTAPEMASCCSVAFRRWHVEHTFRVAKTEIGFGHFEGRSYVGLMRHLIMCLVVMGFVAEHTDRLRGEKSGDHDGAGMPSVEPTLPDLAEESPADDGFSVQGRGHRLPPTAQSCSPNIAPATDTADANVAL